MIWFVLLLLLLLLFRWGVLHRVLVVVGWFWVLYSSSLLCESSHYLILPRVSSLVVYSLGVSAPTPKAQGLIPGQKRKFHKWFVMALSEIKTNTPNWETKDELQTNSSYKIRQIIIKIIEYTHIYPWAKSKQSNKNKVQQIGLTNKGNKLYIYQLRTKLTKAQTGKQCWSQVPSG